jgi:superfamily II DNA or RNA helicase
MYYYPDYNDSNFKEKLLNKREIADNKTNELYCLEYYQRIVSNYIHPLSPYNEILLFYKTGVGKTLSSIAIAENFKKDYTIIVLIKNKIIESVFENELIYTCSNYSTPQELELLKSKLTKTEKEYIISNIKKRIHKHYKFITYNTFVNRTIGRKGKLYGTPIKNINNTVLIIDEVHNIVNNEEYKAVHKILSISKKYKLILLTATPMYDNIKEIFEIANLLNKGLNLPIRNKLLENKYIKVDTTSKLFKNKDKVLGKKELLNNNIFSLTNKGKEIIKKAFKGKVSFLDVNKQNFPTKIYMGTEIYEMKLVICPMSSFQTEYYLKTLNKEHTNKNLVTYSNEKDSSIIDEISLPIGNENKNPLFICTEYSSMIVFPDTTIGKEGFLNNFTKIKNKYKPIGNFLKIENVNTYSCKLYNFYNNIKNSKGPVFIYSSYVTYVGLELIKIFLEENGINSNLIGNIDYTTSPKKRIQILKLFNSPDNKDGSKLKYLLGSTIISEGITLKNVRQLHIFEPHWNQSKIEQIIGRVVRKNSHNILPSNQRNVEIYRYTSVPINNLVDSNNLLLDSSLDITKYILSNSKHISILEIENILKEQAFDSELHPNNSNLTLNKNIVTTTTRKTIDESTFNLKLHDSVLYDFIFNSIVNLFNKFPIYTLDDIVGVVNQLLSLKINKSSSNFILKKTDIYRVLNDIVTTGNNATQNITNVFKIPIFIKYINGYYIAFPKELDGNIKNYYSILYDVFKQNIKNKNLSLSLNEIIKESKPRQYFDIKKEYKTFFDKSKNILGSYINQFGTNDNKFRIIDTRKYKNNIHGKLCMYYDKIEILDIIKHLGLDINVLQNKSKNKLCQYIKDYLVSNNLVIGNN